MRQRFARKHGIALGRVEDEYGHDDGSLFEVRLGEVFVGVEIGVNGAGLIIARILNELEAGETDLIEREVVGGAGIAQRDGRKAEVIDGSHPLLKDRCDWGIAFGEDAEELATSVVGVEVGIEVRMLRLHGDRASLLAEKQGDHLLLRLGGVGESAEMVADITCRAEDALLFATPKSSADRAARLDIEGTQNAHGFESNDTSCAVVGSSGAGDPAIEVAAKHNNLILQRGVGAWDFRDDVLALLVISGELCLDVEAQGDRNIMRNETVDASKGLIGNNCGGKRLFMVRAVDGPAKRPTNVVAKTSIGAAGA